MWHEPAARGRIPSNRHGGYTARMNRRLALTSAVFAIALLLSGCGNKGPLVLPSAPAETNVPEQTPAPDAAVPAPEPAPEAPAPPPVSDTPAR